MFAKAVNKTDEIIPMLKDFEYYYKDFPKTWKEMKFNHCIFQSDPKVYTIKVKKLWDKFRNICETSFRFVYE